MITSCALWGRPEFFFSDWSTNQVRKKKAFSIIIYNNHARKNNLIQSEIYSVVINLEARLVNVTTVTFPYFLGHQQTGQRETGAVG